MRPATRTITQALEEIGLHPCNYPGAAEQIPDFTARIDPQGMSDLTGGTNTTPTFTIDTYEIAGFVPVSSVQPIIVAAWLDFSIDVDPSDPGAGRKPHTIVWYHNLELHDGVDITDEDVVRQAVIHSFATLLGMKKTQEMIAAHLADRDLQLGEAKGAVARLWSTISRTIH